MAAMTLRPSDVTRRRRGAALLATSILAHVAVLSVLALQQPPARAGASVTAIQVSLVPGLPRVRAGEAAAAPRPRPTQSRIVRVSAVQPRYAASAQAPTGDAADAVDLFGPVFADGLWPRPVKVASVACDPDKAAHDADCRRDLMLFGLASGPAARSNAGP